MSTLEKTINLLEDLPDYKIETIYAFVRFIKSDAYAAYREQEEALQSPTSDSSVETRRRGFQGLMSFAGTLPEDFSTSDTPAIRPKDFLDILSK